MSEMDTFTQIIRELEAERNHALNENKNLHAELCRLSLNMKQAHHRLELARREAEETKQYRLDSERLQEVIKKKEEKYLELNNVVNYMKEDKAKIEGQLKTERLHLRDAEKEIYRLRCVLDEKEAMNSTMEAKLYGMKEVEMQNEHLMAQMSEIKNHLQMNEQKSRRQMSHTESLEAELTERNRLLVQMEEEFKMERRAKESIVQAMREMQKEMEAACVSQEKAEAEVEALQTRVHSLTRDLTARQMENAAMRRNVDQIRRDLAAYKKNVSSDENTLRGMTLRSSEAPAVDQAITLSACTSLRPRRTWNALGEPSNISSDAYNRLKLSSYVGSMRPRDSLSEHVLKDRSNTPGSLSKYATSKYRPSAMERPTDGRRDRGGERRELGAHSLRRAYDKRNE